MVQSIWSDSFPIVVPTNFVVFSCSVSRLVGRANKPVGGAAAARANLFALPNKPRDTLQQRAELENE